MDFPAKHGCKDKDVQERFNKIKNHLKLLKPNLNRDEVTTWFKDYCTHMECLIKLLGEFCEEKDESEKEKFKSNFYFYFIQLTSCMLFFIDIFDHELKLDTSIEDARQYNLKQMTWCLTEFELSTANPKSFDDEGHFLKWMDSALDKISELSTNSDKNITLECFKETKRMFEEVLSHGMSIAQVVSNEDCKIIKGSSQAVIEALASLETELNKETPNPSMRNLFIEVCSRKLCKLEERVNKAVLRLTLHIFSESVEHLGKIHKFCFEKSNGSRITELNNLVSNFDLYIDQLMQIGLFAISCSFQTNWALKIRSCLATLESLEIELVPALKRVLLNGCTHNVNYVSLLECHWMNQINIFKNLIYHILDPSAFCEVVFTEIKDEVHQLKNASKVNTLTTVMFNKIINYGKVLKGFIMIAVQLETEEDRKISFNKPFSQFQLVLTEVEASAKKLLNDNAENSNNTARVIKRCRVLQTTIRDMQRAFASDVGERDKEDSETEDQKHEQSSVESIGIKFLDHIINRGKQILNERSILYKTPVKENKSRNMSSNNLTNSIRSSEHGRSVKKNKPVPLSKLVHLRKLTFINSVLEHSKNDMDLDITNILENLSKASSSFSSFKGETTAL